MKTPDSVQELLNEFAARLRAAVERETLMRITGALGAPQVRRGRPPGLSAVAGVAAYGAAPGVRPKQLCPVPGCTNPAVPFYGMTCAAHKEVPKAEIKKFREERKAAAKAAKNGASAPAAIAPGAPAIPLPNGKGSKRKRIPVV